jgi:hypothetical protein
MLGVVKFRLRSFSELCNIVRDRRTLVANGGVERCQGAI